MPLPTRRLGRSDLEVSVVGVGCNAFGSRIDADATTAVVEAALDAGITFFDTADIYGLGESETLLGRALGNRRDEVVVATKFGMDMQGGNGDDRNRRGSRRYVRTAVEASLRRLGTDRIDMYQLHEPDPNTELAETLGAMSELVDEGKVRWLGCSNFAAYQLADAAWLARTNGWHPYVSVQNHWSLYRRYAESELAPAARQFGLGILPYFPLAYGLLTGKYRRDEPAPDGSRLSAPAQANRLADADWDRIDALHRYADERGLSLLDVAIGGLAAQPQVGSVIAGVTRPEQVAANVQAAVWQPDADDLVALDEIAPIAGPRYSTFAQPSG